MSSGRPSLIIISRAEREVLLLKRRSCIVSWEARPTSGQPRPGLPRARVFFFRASRMRAKSRPKSFRDHEQLVGAANWM